MTKAYRLEREVCDDYEKVAKDIYDDLYKKDRKKKHLDRRVRDINNIGGLYE